LGLFALAVSGVAHPGELLAIMGASGAGKTTLLNTLMFRSLPNTEVSGRRAVNGVSITCITVASLAAYVQQDDLFIGTLTVREHLVFQVLLTVVRPEPFIDPRLNKLGSINHAQIIKILVLPFAFFGCS
jgi:ABC-type multidrug transport system ATPase subunit